MEHAGIVRRREDPRLITGSGEFVDDLRVPGCLHAAMLRSPHAHARLRSIDVSTARRAPGVVGVFTAGDLGAAGEPIPIYAPHPALPVPCRIRPLARDRVCFVGEPVVAVIAESAYQAHDALELIRVEYEALPAVVDVEAALAPGAPIVHGEVGSNVVAEWRQRVGDADGALRTADVVVHTRVRLARGGAHPLEPRGLVVRWDGDRLTVWGAVQMVHRHRGVIAGQLGVPEDRVRVIAPPDVGGGFGTKGMYYPEYIVVAALARSLDRPIKWIETRREHTLVACVERDQVHDVEIAATRDGTLLALRDDFVHDMGAYTISGLNLPQNAMIHSVGPYVIPNLDLRFRGVVTTTTPGGAYRGAGRPYGTAVIERAMDALARELKVDPIELRRRNLIAADRHPYATGLSTAGRGPVDYDSGNYPRCMELALETLDLPAMRREQARAREQGRYLGIGVVNYVEATATVPLESAVVRVQADGRITVVSGAAPQGQGHVTFFSHLVGDLLGVDPETIEVLTGDTALVETGGGTYGSRTAAIGGSAAMLASHAVRDKAVRIAAHLLEASPVDIVCDGGKFSVRGLSSRALGWAAVATAAHAGQVPGEAPGLEDAHVFNVAQSSFANGTHAVVLEVDPETGGVSILRWIVAHDCGRVLQPTIVDGQIHGGVVQGLPDALNVQLAYDETGQRLTATLMDYTLATAADAPRTFEIRHLESPTPLNPLGAKGAGEGGIMPVHPLIAQAIEDALAPFGARVERVPVTRADIAAMTRNIETGSGSAGDRRGAGGVGGHCRRVRVPLGAPKKGQTMKIQANGITVNYTLDGPAGAPVATLSHSLATDLSMWDPQMAALTARYRVLRYDTRGHGGTDAPAGAYSLDQLADDARALLQALGVAKTHWIGLSMGGMIGQALALKAPELFLSLSLCDTSSRIPVEAKLLWQERIKTAETQGMEPLVEPTIGRWFTAPFRDQRKDVVDPVREMIRKTPPRGYAGCCAAISTLDLTDRLPAIKIPTLIIVGEEDQGTPVAASQAIQAKIAGSQLEVLKSAAHLANLEQPDAFTNALTSFLARVA